MAYPKPKNITSWSFSRYDTWRQCPAKAKYKFIDKLKEPSAPAMERGTQLHEVAEHYLKYNKPLTKEFDGIKPHMARLKKAKADAEGDLVFTAQWTMTVWNDWDHAWCRIKVDALVPPALKNPEVLIVDFKSGKVRPYGEQLELYAIGGLLKYPQATTARTQLWYIDEGVITPEDGSEEGVYHRDHLPELVKSWEHKVKPMLKDTKFPAKPGNHCRYCHFRKSNNGPCKY